MKNMIALLCILPLFAAAQVPFNRHQKATPVGTDWNQLVPAVAGNYQRISFQLPKPDNDGSAYYKKDKQIIFVSFIKLDDAKQLDEYMKVAKGDVLRSTAETRKVELSGDNKYVLYQQKDKVFFAWNKGLYYFDVMVEGDVNALDEFMSSFPY